jgi:hypothetical protein
MLNSPTIMTWTKHFTIFAHGLLVTPLIIIIFSKDQISVWYLLQTLVGLGMLADAGFGYTLSRAVAFFCAGVDTLPSNKKEFQVKLENKGVMNVDKLASLFSTSYRIYLILSIIFILVFAPLGMAVMWNVMSLTGHQPALWAAYGLTVATTFVTLQTIKWSAYMSGTRRVAELTRFDTIIGVTRIIGFSVLLFFRTGVMALSLYLLIESMVRNLYLRSSVKGWFRSNGVKVKNKLYFDKGIFKSLWTATWRLGLTTWGNYFTVYGTSIIISQVSNTTLMANFLFTQKILGFVQRISEAPFSANVPVIYTYIARKQISEVKAEISRQLFLSISLMIAGFVFIGLFGNELLALLDVDIRFVTGWIFVIFALAIFLDSHATMQGTVYISTNHVPFLIPSLVSGTVMILAGFLILPVYGLLGLVSVKLLVGLGMNNWYSTYLSLKLLDWNFFNYLEDISYKGFKYWRQRLGLMLKPLAGLR